MMFLNRTWEILLSESFRLLKLNRNKINLVGSSKWLKVAFETNKYKLMISFQVGYADLIWIFFVLHSLNNTCQKL